jgi:aerobic-type carbon monoxide dehydrogenase small subunit (CoxS/CutS family)
MAGDVSFYLNGERVRLEDPSPDFLLIDDLQSPDVALTGAKKGRGQGGCGAYTCTLTGRSSHLLRELHSVVVTETEIRVGAAVTSGELTDALASLGERSPFRGIGAAVPPGVTFL